MKNVDNFKTFVRSHPELISYVKKGESTWQQFYELWSLYGEEESTWSKYVKKEEVTSKITDFGWRDIVQMAKNINLESAQKGIANIQRALSLFQDILGKKSTGTEDVYTPRPIYRHFED